MSKQRRRNCKKKSRELLQIQIKPIQTVTLQGNAKKYFFLNFWPLIRLTSKLIGPLLKHSLNYKPLVELVTAIMISTILLDFWNLTLTSCFSCSTWASSAGPARSQAITTYGRQQHLRAVPQVQSGGPGGLPKGCLKRVGEDELSVDLSCHRRPAVHASHQLLLCRIQQQGRGGRTEQGQIHGRAPLRGDVLSQDWFRGRLLRSPRERENQTWWALWDLPAAPVLTTFCQFAAPEVVAFLNPIQPGLFFCQKIQILNWSGGP